MSSSARHISDLGDMDSNWFVLVGGRDGVAGSECFMDQWPPWRQGEMMHIPLRPESVRAAFKHHSRVTPETSAG